MGIKYCRGSVQALMLMLSGIGGSFAADSTITISGSVKEGGCVVSPGSEEFTVYLLSHATKQFVAVGDVTPTVPFSMKLSSCGDGISTVKVGFIGSADVNNTNMLAIDKAANAASGVAIQLMDGNRSQVAINSTGTALTPINIISNGDTVLNFNARMIATKMPVTAGLVTATATFTLEYE